jgi:hypothetical protein
MIASSFRGLAFVVALLLTDVFVLNTGSAAQVATIIKIADTSTPIPGTSMTFTHFDTPSSDLATNPLFGGEPYQLEVTFRAEGIPGYRGIFRASKPLHSEFGTNKDGPLFLGKVVDVTMPMPGYPGNYADFSRPSFGFHGIQWVGKGAGAGQEALYGAGRVIRSDDPRPGGGTFGPIAAHESISTFASFEFNRVTDVFRTTTSPGIFMVAYDQSVTPIATTSTVVPGTANSRFLSFGDPSIARSTVYDGFNLKRDPAANVAFYGTGIGRNGLYAYARNAGTPAAPELFRIVDTTMTAPSGSPFTDFHDPVLSGSGAAFIASTADGRQAIYSANLDPQQRSISTLYTTDLFAPAGGRFISFEQIALDFGSPVVFLARTEDGRQGIYGPSNWWRDRTPLVKYIDTLDLLDGKPIQSLSIAADAVDAVPYELVYHIAFKAVFTDGSEGIYVVVPVVPEPTSIAVALGAAMLLRRKVRQATQVRAGATPALQSA